MLAYHNSVFLLLVVDSFALASGFTLAEFQKRWTASLVIFSGVLKLS